MMFKDDVLNRYEVVSSLDFSKELEGDPFYEQIKDYVIGDSATTAKDAPKYDTKDGKAYKKKFDDLYKKVSGAKTLTLYRSQAVSYYDDDFEDGESFETDRLMSFTDSKEQAMAMAESRAERDRDDEDFDEGESPSHFVISMAVPASRIYFHYKYDKKVASHHMMEREVTINPSKLPIKVLRKFS
jgi:hypothetical protein